MPTGGRPTFLEFVCQKCHKHVRLEQKYYGDKKNLRKYCSMECRKKISPRQAEQIREAHRNKWASMSQLMKKYDIAYDTLRRVIKPGLGGRQTYKKKEPAIGKIPGLVRINRKYWNDVGGIS